MFRILLVESDLTICNTVSRVLAGLGYGLDVAYDAAEAAFAAFKHLQFIACTTRQRQSADVQQLAGRLQTRQDTYTARPYPLYGIVDRIGAGDAFAAGVLHGLIGGFDPQKTIEFATAAGVLKHSIPGDFQLGSVADVELVLSEQQTDVRR